MNETGIIYQYDKIALRRLVQCIKEVRRISPKMPIQALHTLLAVSVEPGITMSELLLRTNLSQSSCSRNVAMLTAQHQSEKPGLDLVVTRDDPKERRRKIVDLTGKGQEFVAILADTVR